MNNNLRIFSSLFRGVYKSSVRPAAVNYSSKSDKTTDEVTIPKDDEIVRDADEIKDEPLPMIDDIDVEAREAEIEAKRNKSRLLPQHRRLLHGQQPYDEPESWVHRTLKYNRTMYGRYGAASGVDPRLLFNTPEEKEEARDYEATAFPHTLQEMVDIVREKKAYKAENTRKRTEDLAKKFGKLNQWTNELNARVAKKEAEALAARQRKERIIEEVRRHFGFKVDPRDQRFKDMLAAKEKEDKKNLKQQRQQLKAEKALSKMQGKIDLEAPKEDAQKKKKKDESDE